MIYFTCVCIYMCYSHYSVLSYNNICALAGDQPSVAIGGLIFAMDLVKTHFPHLLCAVCSTLARGALEQKCYQTNIAMRKYESMLTRLDAAFLMTTIRWICNMAFLTNGGALTSKTNQQWGALKVLVAILDYKNWSRWCLLQKAWGILLGHENTEIGKKGTHAKQQLRPAANHFLKND